MTAGSGAGPAGPGAADGVAALAAEIVRLVGGRANVADVTHCYLRLRLTLTDPAGADREALRALPAVVVLVDQDGQLQLALRGDLYAVHDAVRDIVDAAASS